MSGGDPDRDAGGGEPAGFTTIALVRRAWGRRGEVIAEITTGFPERFERTRDVWLARGESEREAAQIEQWRFHQRAVVLKFAGVDDIDAADGLAGCEVQIPVSERQALPEGAVYVGDLEGCRVVEGGREIGTVRHLDPTVGTPVLVVDTPEGELLVPFAEAICKRVDVAQRVIEVELPEGLRDLNRGG